MGETLVRSQILDSLKPQWKMQLAPYFQSDSFGKLIHFLNEQYSIGKSIYPKPENIFRALQSTDLPDVKVVIFGQDPYHGAGQAIGYSFAVPNDHLPKPPSLKNIFKEIESDLSIRLDPLCSDLSSWVSQGVLLLNTVFTVEAEKPLSHRDRGWEEFSSEVIRVLDERNDPLVFVLWGGQAQKLKVKINNSKHSILECAHPSPLSAYRGFLGSRIFSKVNEALHRLGKPPIDWDPKSKTP